MASLRTPFVVAVAALLLLPLVVTAVGDSLAVNKDPIPVPPSEAAAIAPEAPAPPARPSTPRPSVSPNGGAPVAGKTKSVARYDVVLADYLAALEAGPVSKASAEGTAFKLDELAAFATTPACGNTVLGIAAAIREADGPRSVRVAQAKQARRVLPLVC